MSASPEWVVLDVEEGSDRVVLTMGHADHPYWLYVHAPDLGMAVGMAGRRRGGLGDWRGKHRSAGKPPGQLYPSPVSAEPSRIRQAAVTMQAMATITRRLLGLRTWVIEHRPYSLGVIYRPVPGGGLAAVPLAKAVVRR